MNSKGIPWYVDFRGNRIGELDPGTDGDQGVSRCRIADARPRRIAITQDDVIWYTDYARGYLGRSIRRPAR